MLRLMLEILRVGFGDSFGGNSFHLTVDVHVERHVLRKLHSIEKRFHLVRARNGPKRPRLTPWLSFFGQ